MPTIRRVCPLGLHRENVPKTGPYAPAFGYYLCKVHGRAAGSVRVNGAAVSHYPGTAASGAATGQGWTTGRDIYGDVTWVKVGAGVARKVAWAY